MDDLLAELELTLSKENPKFKKPIDRNEVFNFYMVYLLTKAIDELRKEVKDLKPKKLEEPVVEETTKPVKKLRLKEVE